MIGNLNICDSEKEINFHYWVKWTWMCVLIGLVWKRYTLVWAGWWRDRGAVGGVLLCCLSAVCPSLCYTGAQLASSTFFVCRFFPWWGKITKVISYWLPHVVIILQSCLVLVWNERSPSSAISWPGWPSLLRMFVTVLIVNYPSKWSLYLSLALWVDHQDRSNRETDTAMYWWVSGVY